MWHVSEHRRSWTKKHALDIGTAIGTAVFFALPLIVWMLGLA